MVLKWSDPASPLDLRFKIRFKTTHCCGAGQRSVNLLNLSLLFTAFHSRKVLTHTTAGFWLWRKESKHFKYTKKMYCRCSSQCGHQVSLSSNKNFFFCCWNIHVFSQVSLKCKIVFDFYFPNSLYQSSYVAQVHLKT